MIRSLKPRAEPRQVRDGVGSVCVVNGIPLWERGDRPSDWLNRAVALTNLCPVSLQVSTSNSQPILQLAGDGQSQGELGASGQTMQSVQLVNPGTFLIQAQTVSATGQIQWQTFQVRLRLLMSG